MVSAPVIVKHDGPIAEVVLTRPEVLNAIDTTMAEMLLSAFRDLAGDEKVRVLILRGDGERAFCAGADLKERRKFTLEDWQAQRRLFREMFGELRAFPQPAIASVHGFVLGGGFELALLCDVIVGSDDAVFGLPEATLGLIPGGNGVITLTHAVGPRRAKELLLSGRRVGALEALSLGIVTKAVPSADLRSATAELARSFVRSSPISARAIKTLVRSANAPDVLELEERLYQEVIGSPERAEGIAAFSESRLPRW